MSTYIITNGGELYHYGVKGMRWGHRKKHPDVSTTEHKRYRKIGESGINPKRKGGIDYKTGKTSSPLLNDVKKVASKNGQDAEAEKKGLTDNQKKAIIAGTAVVGTALAAYGGYKLNKYLNTSISQKYQSKGELFVQNGWDAKRYVTKYQDLADKAKFLSDKSLREAQYTSNMNTAKELEKSAVRTIREGNEYLRRAQQTGYSTREKADYLRKAYKNRYNKGWQI